VIHIRYLIPIAILILLSSCTAQAPDEGTAAFHVEVTDDLGRTVTVDGVPDKIVSAAPSNTEILFALGLEDRVIGVTEYCTYPPEAGEKEKIGGFSTVNLERVVALEPDLVLGSTQTGEEVVEELEGLGIPIVITSPKDIEGILRDIEMVGEVTGAEEEAGSLIEQMRKRIFEIEEGSRPLEEGERQRVLYVVWHDPLITAGSDTFADDLIEKAGGKNIAKNLTGYKGMGIESIVAGNPEVIICSVSSGAGGHDPATLEYVKADPKLASTSAVKNGKVYGIDSDIVSRGGPRIVEALEAFERYINPDQ